MTSGLNLTEQRNIGMSIDVHSWVKYHPRCSESWQALAIGSLNDLIYTDTLMSIDTWFHQQKLIIQVYWVDPAALSSKLVCVVRCEKMFIATKQSSSNFSFHSFSVKYLEQSSDWEPNPETELFPDGKDSVAVIAEWQRVSLHRLKAPTVYWQDMDPPLQGKLASGAR